MPNKSEFMEDQKKCLMTGKKHSRQREGSTIFSRITWKDRAAYHARPGASAVETEETEVNLWDIRVQVSL